MQKPAAYRASVLLLLLVVLIHAISVVEAADQHEQVCIPPGANGVYNVAYNKAGMHIEKQADVQDSVLERVNDLVTKGLTKGRHESCARGRHFYSPIRGGHSIYLFTYGHCGQGIDRPRCSDCLTGAAQVIKQFCPDSCSGAQASSVDCCIRFEPDSFCKFTQ